MQITLLFTSFSTTEPFPEIFRLTFKNVYYIIGLVHRRVICLIRNNSWIRCRLKCPLSYSAFLYSNFGKYCNCYTWKHMKNYYKRNKNYMKENMSFTEGKIMQPLLLSQNDSFRRTDCLTGDSRCILRQSADILYYEYPAKYLSVPYRTGNTNVLYIAVDSLCWIYALAAKKQTVR